MMTNQVVAVDLEDAEEAVGVRGAEAAAAVLRLGRP